MPFNIELDRKPDMESVDISLQILEQTITIYFKNPDFELAKEIRSKWIAVERRYLATLPELGIMLAVDDETHTKLHHVHFREALMVHTHNEFSIAINPGVLANYLNCFIQEQANESRFFITQEEINQILEKYGAYHREYVGSAVQHSYLEERELTDSQRRQYDSVYRENQHIFFNGKGVVNRLISPPSYQVEARLDR